MDDGSEDVGEDLWVTLIKYYKFKFGLIIIQKGRNLDNNYYVKIYVDLKRKEQVSFHSEISNTELKWYLNL